MKEKTLQKKKITALLLVLLLLFQLTLTVAFAAEEPTMPYYVAIGDSIAGGYGLRGNSIEQLSADTKFLTNVVRNSAESCYPRLVANAIAKATTGKCKASDEEFANLGALGFAVTDFYYAFSETDETKLKNYVSPFWEKVVPLLSAVLSPGQEVDWDSYRWAETVVSETKKADLITFNVGANDVMQPLWETMTSHENPLIKVMGILLKMATLEVDLTKLDLREAISNLSAADTGGIDLSGMLSGINADTIRECITFFDTRNLAAIMCGSVEAIRDIYGETLDRLREINPEAKIVLVGTHNPYGNSNLYHGTYYTPEKIFRQLHKELAAGKPMISPKLVEGIQYTLLHYLLGKTAQPALNRLNEIIKDAAAERDIPFVYTMDKVKNEARIAVHPTKEQHQQIANAITDVLLPLICQDSSTEKEQPSVCDSLCRATCARWKWVEKASRAYWKYLGNAWSMPHRR